MNSSLLWDTLIAPFYKLYINQPPFIFFEVDPGLSIQNSPNLPVVVAQSLELCLSI